MARRPMAEAIAGPMPIPALVVEIMARPVVAGEMMMHVMMEKIVVVKIVKASVGKSTAKAAVNAAKSPGDGISLRKSGGEQDHRNNGGDLSKTHRVQPDRLLSAGHYPRSR
jgi:hypothetical protein